MKKVLLLAYTNKNFGDDMFIRTICDYFPQVSFFLEASDEYVRIFQDCKNLRVVKQSIFIKAARKIDNKIYAVSKKLKYPIRYKWIKQFDAVVYVIGALFDDDDLWRAQVEERGVECYKSALWKKSFYHDTPFLILGCNMSRVRSEEYIEMMNYIFEGLTDICFRDRYSWKYFSDLQNTRYAPDIVFNFNCTERKKEKTALLSVWGPLTRVESFPQWKWAESWWDNYCEFIVEVANTLIERGYDVILLSLCEAEGDLDACKVVRDKAKKNLEILNYTGNLDEIISMFEKSEFVVGTRFHSIVMAINAKCKFLPIIYESKTKELLKDVGYRGPYTTVESVNTKDIHCLLEACDNNPAINLTEIKERAKKQFEKLKDLLEK